jgi:hypothetical protein
MRQQVLLGLNRVDLMEPLLSKPKLPELPERMKIGPQLPHGLIDLEPLHGDHDPKQRRRRRAKWALLQPPTQSKPPSDKPPLKPLPPVEPPPPPQPRELQNRPNTKGRNTKNATFKVSFVEPQIEQRQEQQRQEQRAPDRQEDQHQAADIRWRTVNQTTRKWVRKKDPTTTSREAIGNGTASNSSLIDVDVRGRSLEPPVDRPLEPLKHQTSIQIIDKNARRRQQREVAAQPEDLIESVEEPVRGRNLRSRRARNLENT